MKKAIILMSALWISTLATQAQRKRIDLSGVWVSSLGEYQLPGTTDEKHLGDGQHPTNVTSQLTRLYPYTGIVTYERDVEIPIEMTNKHITLELERTKPSTLWVDGDSVGSISQLCAPHVYVLPPLKAGIHHLKLHIDNRNEAVPEGVRGSHAWTDATQTNWNGIIGRMELVATPHTYIQDMQLYPDVEMNEVRVKLTIVAEKAGKYDISIERSVYENELGEDVRLTKKLALQRGENQVELLMDMGENPHLWSEFHPDLYTMTATLKGKSFTDQTSRTFGMRHFSTEGTQFVINGNRTFLRGTHDGCVFPLTGYCPADVATWKRLFAIAKQYGINHYRFHSYTPTEAAFTAADELGIYLHTELPLWGRIDSTTVAQNDFLRQEAFTTLQFLGNHPSFISMGLGNELWGVNDMMYRWLNDFREADSRHLYNQGSNNDLGFRGPKQGEDFYITCRVGNSEDFSTHTRTSFSFTDADHGGILNWNRPTTQANFSHAVSLCNVPIVSHETCQFQIYPDYKEIPKYTGVLYPYNHEIFRDRLQQNGLTPQIDDFHQATGRWAIDCYKADMEYCLRTPRFGGYQLLDIKDYPGQGSALCGILDAFMDSKGITTPDEFRGWNNAVVPLAEMETHCWSTLDTLRVHLAICNYTEDDYHQPLTWVLYSVDNQGNRTNIFDREGKMDYVDAWQGSVEQVGTLESPLHTIQSPTQLRLELATGEYHNYYNLWVYPSSHANSTFPTASTSSTTYLHTDTLDSQTIRALQQGKTVLLTPRHTSIESQSVGGLFTPDYWNYAMFKSISENNHRPVSPGTLGMLMNPAHPFFTHFPTEGRSDWQWWSIALHSRPLILNSLEKSYRPLIQTVDNVERNHKLGILMDFQVGKGKVLLSTTDFNAISPYVEGRAYTEAIFHYISSPEFQPETTISIDQLRELLYNKTTTPNIQGVKNQTDYKMK